jgi:hypothetical protein
VELAAKAIIGCRKEGDMNDPSIAKVLQAILTVLHQILAEVKTISSGRY